MATATQQELAVVESGPIEIPTPTTLLKMAVAQGAGIETLTKLMELKERVDANELQMEAIASRRAFDAAMVKFKENPPRINKNKHVEFGNTKYDHATLDHVTDLIAAGLSKVGIRHRWTTAQSDKDIAVTCVLSLGTYSEETTLRAQADNSGSKNSIQAIASAVTYLQRYTLLAATGMAAKGMDNDGAAANGSGGMPEAILAERLKDIADCQTMSGLQIAFSASYKLATAARDKNAQARINAAKDARKKELANAG